MRTRFVRSASRRRCNVIRWRGNRSALVRECVLVSALLRSFKSAQKRSKSHRYEVGPSGHQTRHGENPPQLWIAAMRWDEGVSTSQLGLSERFLSDSPTDLRRCHYQPVGCNGRDQRALGIEFSRYKRPSICHKVVDEMLAWNVMLPSFNNRNCFDFASFLWLRPHRFFRRYLRESRTYSRKALLI